MKLFELYTLSFIEPFDVIKAIDPEKADIIRKVNIYNDIKAELAEKGISTKMLGQMRKIKSGFDNCEDLPGAISRIRSIYSM